MNLPTKVKDRRKRRVPLSYIELILEFPLTSIKSAKQLDLAQTMIDHLLFKGNLDTGEELYLEALSDLIASYEDVHYSIDPASDADMLRHLMEARAVTQAELHRQTGISKSALSEVLTGKKGFSKAMIRTLSEFFKVEAGILTSNL